MSCLEFFSGVFINRKYYYLGLREGVEQQFNPNNRIVVLIYLLKNIHYEVRSGCCLLCHVTHPISWLILQVSVLTMFTLITLYSTIIPISLYVSIEVGAIGFFIEDVLI